MLSQITQASSNSNSNSSSTYSARRIIVILPSAGIGERMGAKNSRDSTMPKQYLLLHGKTILERSVELFLPHEEIKQIIVAIAKNDEIAPSLSFAQNPKVKLVIGGETRAETVRNALLSIENKFNTWALVHDTARPCVRWEDIQNLIQIQELNGGLLAVPVVDTVKTAESISVSPSISGKIFSNSEGKKVSLHTVDRSNLWLAQTPQFFKADILLQALEQALSQGENITDEASCMELAGFKPQLVLGSRSNLKITYPEDLALAEFYLSKI